MMQLHLPITVLKGTLLTISVVCLTLIVHPLTLAQYVPSNPTRPGGATGSTAPRGYTPPKPSRPRGTTGSTGTRGGCEDTSSASSTPLTTLAPQQHLGRTSSSHPTFVWYVPSQQSLPIEVTLFEYGANGRGKRLQTFDLQSSPGIMQWTLPQSQPGLTAGQTYVWQVALICNPNRPSQNQWMEAVVEVATVPADLKTVLSQTTDPLKRAEAYAEAGFWYDALAETFKSPAARSFRLTLLEQLSQSEAPEQKAQLQAIVASERRSRPNP